jgi:hypothetical protein
MQGLVQPEVRRSRPGLTVARGECQNQGVKRSGTADLPLLRDFASLLLVEQLGPRTLQSLALIAEVVHGTPTRFEDPARFSFAHGVRTDIRSRCR